MKNLRSRGTTFGMQRYYYQIPLCRFCRKVKCSLYPQRDIVCCAACYKKETGLTIRESIDIFRTNNKGKCYTYEELITELKTKLQMKEIQR